MARKLFERQAIRRRTGALAAGVAMVVYTDAAGTVLADISASSGGSAIAGSTVTTADIAGFGPAALQFWGPPDGTDTLFIRVPSDTSLGVQEIEAATDPRLDALEAGGGGGGIAATIFDAKGDLIVATAADTAARLAVGTAGQVLEVDSAATAGFKWATLPEIDVTAAPYNVVPGAANSSTGMQAAIDAGETTGRALRLPAGTINCNVQVGDNVTMFGAGRMKTILKSVASSNIDVIKGKNFATLTNSNPAAPETAGDNALHLFDLCIDGNRDNTTQGYGIRIWGVGHVFRNIIVRNCSQDGIHTEFAQEVDTFSGDWGVLEGDFDGIETIHNDGNGWTFLGPHDSWINNFVTYGNGGWGLESRFHATNYDGVMHGTNWNSFLNTSGSYKLGSAFNLGFVIASGAATGIGVDIQPGIADCSIQQLLVGGHETGLILRGANHHISGTFETCTTVAVELNVTANCILDLTVDNCAKVFTVTSDQGYHHIRGRIHLVGGQVLKTGTFQTDSAIDIRDSGGIGNFFQHPVVLSNGQTSVASLGVAAEAAKQLLVKGQAAADTIVVVRGVASQSGTMLQLEDSTSTPVLKMDVGGNIVANTFQPIQTPGTGTYIAFNSNQMQFLQRSAGALVLAVRGAASQTGDLTQWQDSTGAQVAAVQADGKLAFVAANQATTVGAAGGASALPATPTGYFLVKDSGDTTRKVPYYAS